MYVSMYVCMYVCMFVHACMCACMYVCMYVCMYAEHHILLFHHLSLSLARACERERERATGHISKYMNANTQFWFASCVKSKLSDHRLMQVASARASSAIMISKYLHGK